MDLDPDLHIRPAPAFAHASEAELARILDFYAVAWEYEPRTFPILFDRSGAVLESFSPDFYLPELDVYLELTTLKQRLVRKKNRKLRRLRELYPAVRIKLLYARDFRALLFKYGKLSLAAALTGADGQTTPARARPPRSTSEARLAPLPVAPASVGAGADSSVGPGSNAHAAARDHAARPLHPPIHRAEQARRRTRRTRAEARARAASERTVPGQGDAAQVTA